MEVSRLGVTGAAMDRFEFFFALISLLLGLALTQVASGLASALKARRRVRLGWLTPLTAVLVCLDIASMWPGLWSLREVLEVRALPMTIATLMCLGYYVAAAFVFPDSFEGESTLDDWYSKTAGSRSAARLPCRS